jgi:hypothetical protein
VAAAVGDLPLVEAFSTVFAAVFLLPFALPRPAPFSFLPAIFGESPWATAGRLLKAPITLKQTLQLARRPRILPCRFVPFSGPLLYFGSHCLLAVTVKTGWLLYFAQYHLRIPAR